MNRLSEVFCSNRVDLLALPLALGLSVTALIVGLQREHWDAEDGARESGVAIQDRVERVDTGPERGRARQTSLATRGLRRLLRRSRIGRLRPATTSSRVRKVRKEIVSGTSSRRPARPPSTSGCMAVERRALSLAPRAATNATGCFVPAT